jgi:hypothetical protein
VFALILLILFFLLRWETNSHVHEDVEIRLQFDYFNNVA